VLVAGLVKDDDMVTPTALITKHRAIDLSATEAQAPYSRKKLPFGWF